MIVVDALRADRVGVLGGRELTPNIDRFASDAAVFSQAFSTTNATDSAITSLLTGRYPLSHGIINHGRHVNNNEMNIVDNVRSLPEVLSNEGYHTAKIGRPLGRWHRNGFDKYPDVGEKSTAKDVNKSVKKELEIKSSNILYGISPKAANFASKWYWHLNTAAESFIPRSNKSGGGETDIVVKEFEETIQNDCPFFTLVHLMDTHIPYDSDMELARAYADSYDYKNVALNNVAKKFPESSSTYHKLTAGGSIYDSVSRWRDTEYGIGTAAVKAHYDAAVTEADQRVGKILTALRENNLSDDTLVVVMSDHGESLTEHDIYFDHHGLYHQSTHIPLIVRPPGGVDSTHRELVQITDVAPTVLSYLELEDELDADGQSLVPTIENDESPTRDVIYTEEANTQRRRAVYNGKHKLIYAIDDNTICRYCEVEHAPDVELFNLETDPKEKTNIASNNERITTELSALGDQAAKEYIARQPTLDDNRNDITYDEEEEIYDRLDALGYR